MRTRAQTSRASRQKSSFPSHFLPTSHSPPHKYLLGCACVGLEAVCRATKILPMRAAAAACPLCPFVGDEKAVMVHFDAEHGTDMEPRAAKQARIDVDDDEPQGDADVAVVLQRTRTAHLVLPPRFFASPPSGRSWQCGYRNAQMLLSHLLDSPRFPTLRHALSSRVPSVARLQALMVEAWARGFDPQGARQLGGAQLIGSRRWVGVTDLAGLLRAHAVAARVVTVRIGGALGNDSALFAVVEAALAQPDASPVLVQWAGHSVTCVGVDRAGSKSALVVLDPGLQGPLRQASANQLRRVPTFWQRKKELQLLVVEPRELTVLEAEAAKVLGYSGLHQEIAV